MYVVKIFKCYSRPINNKNVAGFISIIANDKYDTAYPIRAIGTQRLFAKGYEVTNLKSEKLTQRVAKEYFCILDGQHRSKAFAKLNITSGTFYIILNVQSYTYHH